MSKMLKFLIAVTRHTLHPFAPVILQLVCVNHAGPTVSNASTPRRRSTYDCDRTDSWRVSPSPCHPRRMVSGPEFCLNLSPREYYRSDPSWRLVRPWSGILSLSATMISLSRLATATASSALNMALFVSSSFTSVNSLRSEHAKRN